MNLRNLKDNELHAELLGLIQNERTLLANILHHLREVDERKLHCDFSCSSLFDYAVKVLGYSEGQAYRRIQAMRLLRELPVIEQHIADGSLSLSNIAQAQSVFNNGKKGNSPQLFTKNKKLEVLNKLKNKSAREGQKTILSLFPDLTPPAKECERPVQEEAVEVRFVVSKELKEKLEEVRSLLGPKGFDLSYAELFNQMAELSLTELRARKFGKKRSTAAGTKAQEEKPHLSTEDQPALKPHTHGCRKTNPCAGKHPQTSTSKVEKPNNSRYIPAKVKHAVWQRDQGKCQSCGAKRNLHYDHCLPFAKKGSNSSDNLRLLCQACNQHAAIRVYGREFIHRKVKGNSQSG